jgi:hypothetical protein
MFTVKLDAPTEKPLPCTVTVDWNVAWFVTVPPFHVPATTPVRPAPLP